MRTGSNDERTHPPDALPAFLTFHSPTPRCGEGRRRDPAHYLCATLLRPEHRANALVAQALNCELDQVLQTSTKAQFASLKLKWWTDAISKVCK